MAAPEKAPNGRETGDDDGLLCGNPMSKTARPADGLVRHCLGAVLASDTFARSERLRSFLAYVVENELSGKAAQLKGYSIGIDVFGRPPGFDAGTDPLVRVQAGKLRKLLDQYYEREGAADALRIRIPLGSYVPEYEMAGLPSSEPVAPEPPVAASVLVRKRARPRSGWLPAPVSSPLALFSLLPLFFLMPSTYPEAANTTIAQVQLTLAVQDKLAGRPRSLPHLRVLHCWPGGAECSALAGAIHAAAAFYKTVRLLEPRDGGQPHPLSYSVRIDSRADGRAVFARLVHDQSGRTVYAKHFWRGQLKNEGGVSYEAVSFVSHALTANGPLYRHALRSGTASSFMQCLSLAERAPSESQDGPAGLLTCTAQTSDALAEATAIGAAGARSATLTQ